MAEGWEYLEDHFRESGFIPHKDERDIFAIHTNKPWKEVLELIKDQWGYARFFMSAIVIKKTNLKNGQTNFVFRII